jgi:hypothetical protein
MRRYRIVLALSVIASLLPIALALAAGEGLPRAILGSGGGSVSGDGLHLRAAIGQAVVGGVAEQMTLCSGFLCGPGAPARAAELYSIYIPLVVE